MSEIRVAIAQHPPVWMNRTATLEKTVGLIHEAGSKEVDLVVFGESFVPGYPFWLSWAGGAAFNDPQQKRWFAHYLSQAVDVQGGDLETVQKAARETSTAVYIGIAEKAMDRSGHSVYCALVYINKQGEIGSVHRKLQPTYEERLVWAVGDGHGLRVHDLEAFRVGGLNCWENWMPLARTALQAQGENVHVAVWPGSVGNTQDITRFAAREARSYMVSASPPMDASHVDSSMPDRDVLLDLAPAVWGDGGSCIAAPTGEWLMEPQTEVGLYINDLTLNPILEERQNFDPTGHYSRPDITQLHIDRTRQSVVRFTDSKPQ